MDIVLESYVVTLVFGGKLVLRDNVRSLRPRRCSDLRWGN